MMIVHRIGKNEHQFSDREAYLAWCEQKGETPLPDEEIERILALPPPGHEEPATEASSDGA